MKGTVFPIAVLKSEDLYFFLFLVEYLSSYHEKAINALYELAYELPAICLPHQDGGIPLSVIPNGTTSKLAGLFSSLSLLMLSVMQLSCEYQFQSHWFDPT